MSEDKKKLLFTGVAAAILFAAVYFLLLAPPANAADKYSPPGVTGGLKDDEPSTVHSPWNGLTIEIGGGLGISEADISAGAEAYDGPDTLNLLNAGLTSGASDVIGHIGVGYDWMFAPGFVIGGLARVEFGSVEHNAGIGIFDNAIRATAKGETEDVTFMVGGRLGWVPNSNWMFYGLVGYKFENDMTFSYNVSCGGVTCDSGSASVSRDGWVLGAGVETVLRENWFVGVEYTALLADDETLWSFDEDFGCPGGCGVRGGIDVGGTDHAVKARLGYRF